MTKQFEESIVFKDLKCHCALFNSMRVITWNVQGANKSSHVWKLLLDLQPDIILVQEIGNIPGEISKVFEVLTRATVGKTAKIQHWCSH